MIRKVGLAISHELLNGFCQNMCHTDAFIEFFGASIAQWVKCWPTDLAVPSSSPSQGEIFSTVKRGSIAYSLSLLPAHRLDMTKILMKRM